MTPAVQSWPQGSPLETAVLVCHTVLALAVAALVFSFVSSLPAGLALAVLAAAPLLATLHKLAASAHARPWVALLLVLYAGAASIEVVATLGAAHLASVVLLAAVLELGMLLAVIRRSRTLRPASGE